MNTLHNKKEGAPRRKEREGSYGKRLSNPPWVRYFRANLIGTLTLCTAAVVQVLS